MKNFFTGSLIIVAAVVILINSSCNSKAAGEQMSTGSTDPLAVPALFERKGELANASEWQKTKEKATALIQKINTKKDDVKSRLQLATIFMSEARITGEHPYYYPAIIQLLDGVLALDNKNFEALVYKASVKMSQHKFVEARDLAEKARAINQDNAYIYGVLVDANVELGNYEEAVAMSDKMQAIKPSLESYARASYLREIYGDYPGSIDAMKMAVKAGMPGSEPWCWTKNILGKLYMKTGSLSAAQNEYNDILTVRPSYAFAIEGLAQLEKSKGNYVKALDLLHKATVIMPEFSFFEEIADIKAMSGKTEEANKEYNNVVEMLRSDEISGHDVSLDMGKLLIKAGRYDEALKLLNKEFETRPKNIDVNTALARLYNIKGDKDKAREHIKAAMVTGSKDPELMKIYGEIK